MNRRNAMVTFAPANVMIAQNAAKERMKNDLPLPVTARNLHCRCDYRKDEYEDMTNAEMFWKTFGLRQKNTDEQIV